jgi:hypothetical protein
MDLFTPCTNKRNLRCNKVYKQQIFSQIGTILSNTVVDKNIYPEYNDIYKILQIEKCLLCALSSRYRVKVNVKVKCITFNINDSNKEEYT